MTFTPEDQRRAQRQKMKYVQEIRTDSTFRTVFKAQCFEDVDEIRMRCSEMH